MKTSTISDVVKDLENEMQCNCDLDNWEPERDTGHSWVCRIHQAARARWFAPWKREAKRSEYPEGWPDFAKQVKDEAGWKCERCKHQHDPAGGHVLTVHHLTGNKQQPFTDRWAFAALCQRCHLKIQGRVKMDQMFFAEILDVSEWFKPHLQGFLLSKIP